MSQHQRNEELGCMGGASLAIALVLGLVGSGMAASSHKNLGEIVIVAALLIGCAGLAMLTSMSQLQDKGQLGPRDRRRLAQTFGQLQIRIRPKQRCPYCHDGINGQTYECPACKAIYHSECLEEARGCTTLGCVHKAKPRRVRA